jgi:two-component system response regulator
LKVAVEGDALTDFTTRPPAYVTKPVDFDQYLKAVRQIDEFFVQVLRPPPRG